MQWQDTPLALDPPESPEPDRRLSAPVAMLTIGLLSGALWAGLFRMLGWGL